MRLLNFLLGRPLSTDEDGPEALLTALLPLGAAGIGYMGLLTAVIVVLLLNVVSEIAEEHAGRPVAVVVPELVEPRWYQQLLHGQTAALLRHRLRARGGPRLVIVNTPWYLRDWLPERRWLRSIHHRLRRKRANVEQRAAGTEDMT